MRILFENKTQAENGRAANRRFTSGEIAALSWHNGGCNSAERFVET